MKTPLVMEHLECPICLFLLCEPVTMSCGHSFCRRCIMGICAPSRCPVCSERLKQTHAKNIRNNVLLFSIIEKYCPEETRTRCEIQERLRARDFPKALCMAEDRMETVADDLSLKVWRAEANIGLLCFSEALRDLEDLCCARPNWTEAFFRKGNVLLEMGRRTEALVQFHHCLKKQPEFAAAKNHIRKILDMEGMATPEEVSQILQIVDDYLQDCSSQTNNSGSPLSESLNLPWNQLDKTVKCEQTTSQVKPNSSTECCLSLCQPVSFLSTAQECEELMVKKEDIQMRVDQETCPLTVSDFECPLCIRLFYDPVTTPCGHTFCKNCIERSLDHNLRCPLCKQPLQEYFKNRKYNPTVLLQEIMTHLFPQQLAERKQVHDAEMAELSNLTKDIPIFVCTVAYPGIPCPLHVFEPRYRLMMRRCIETGTKKFGMCNYEHGKGFTDYGCMLEILDQDVFPDGRSYVNTVGGSRFRVLRRGQRDGYHTADIEYLQDHKAHDAELEMLQCLHDSVYQQAREWYQRLSSRIREQINHQHGDMPEREDNIQASADGPAWCWWLLSVLQLDPAYQTTVLSLTSLMDRLGHLRIVLEYFSQR
ncbi:LON peptidase N-terminal domain and RING finger protein 1 isoform X2 [Neoarius graeffei]|uniref:LON peptidase N-terminal domain and RING finger protein 1 isoform X2 n=1 Tax=Neoarius graeffei TaxID=443677 RepID=UPI00298D1409|nr:LON peptidase N-terminal domain and RING finger protein 1 isoform X2 [Neoarius graeffei]